MILCGGLLGAREKRNDARLHVADGVDPTSVKRQAERKAAVS
jgi:hypothetical protein